MRKIILILILGIGVLALWIFFPIIFRFLVLHVLVTPPFTSEVFASLGPIGDIFGGLTALFTSATLIIVMYSAYLQRQANEDARNAMAEQLQQARDATAQQLRQARDATAQQLRQARKALRLQLQQAEESTTKQLELAESSHKAQILESQHAIFSSTFNILLSQKKVVLDNIYTGKEEFKPKFIFETLGCEFEHMIVNDWRELDHRNTKDEEIIFSYFLNTMDGEIQKSFCFNELVSYFYMLVPLILLIKNSKLRDEDKKIFYMVLSHSMTHYEQVTLLWFTLFSPDLKEALTDTQLIDTKFENNEMYFIMKNFSKSCFIHPEVLEHWNNLTKKPS